MEIEEIQLFGREHVKVFAKRPATIDSLLTVHLEDKRDKAALVTEKASLTYEELENRSKKVAAYLQKHCGVTRGDRVATIIGNHSTFPVVLFACMKLGAIMVPVNTKLSAEETEYILSHSEIKVLISENDYTTKMEAIEQRNPTILPASSHRFTIDGEPSFERLLNHDFSFTPVQVHELDPAFILYTSGTTGRPKGAVLTHINVIHSVMNYQGVFDTNETMNTLIAVPMFHVTGLVGQLLHQIYIGGTSYSMERYKNEKYIDLILRHNINFLFNVPTIFIMMSTSETFQKNQFDFVEKVAFGGSPIYRETFRMLEKAFPNASLHNAYGATETTSPATLMPVHYSESKVTSVGKPVPVADLKIVDEYGEPCEIGDIGEIYIKGPMVVKEYWRNEEANQQNFTNGYWHSGDIGFLDEEGFLYVQDRIKDMINRGGEKVFSIEVEDVLKNHEYVDEAAVVGVPDEVYGERVKAFVVGKNLKGNGVEEVREYCSKQLAKYKVPEIFEVLDELPRNASGKILKKSLKGKRGMEHAEADFR